MACERGCVKLLSAIPGIWVQWLRGCFWTWCVPVQTAGLLAAARHTVTLHRFRSGCSLWAVPYFCTWLSQQPPPLRTSPWFSSPSFLAPFHCLCCLLGKSHGREREGSCVCVGFLFCLLIFIIRTGNVNFLLHLLTPLRKLQVKDRIWSKLTDNFWHQLCVCAWGAWCWHMQELEEEYQKAA